MENIKNDSLFGYYIIKYIKKKVRKNERVLNCYLKCWKKSEINDVIYGILQYKVDTLGQ